MLVNRLREAAGALARDIVVNTLLSSKLVPRPARGAAMRLIYRDIHGSAAVSADCFFGGWQGIAIGERSFVNYGCFFDLGASISLGAHVSVGYQTLFITSTHELGPSADRAGQAIARPIAVGDGAWIGARVTVLPGVTIGDGAVVAAGSTVITDVEPDTLYAGSPATRKRLLPTSAPQSQRREV